MDLKYLAILITVAVFVACSSKGDNLDAEQVQKLVNEGATILDVRTQGEFSGGHVPGAVNIPVQELQQRLGTLEPRDRPVIVYCKKGARASRAKGILQKAGFARVYNLGGMSNWPLSR